MTNSKYIWIFGLLGTLALLALPIFVFLPAEAKPTEDPWSNMPDHPVHVDHSYLLEGPLETGPEVTLACLECHEEAANQMMETAHWTWESEPVLVDGRDQLVATGKKNVINNFCIGIQSNWPGCTSCHAGYGWEDAEFDFENQEVVDCLVCHDGTGTYIKGNAGYPLEGVDLLAVAQSVGAPTRENCGSCHFRGGGGDAVKHGDLDESLYYPTEDVDVHMGRYGFICTDCHQAQNHVIQGRSISVSVDNANQVYCTDCHGLALHADDRINEHTGTVACQTCHIPEGAVRQATKTHWDWSTAGQDLEEDSHEYLKIKGTFVYQRNFVPEYYWYTGIADRYLLGDVMDPNSPTPLNHPQGDIANPAARIWPFKVHRARQIYDAVNNYLLQPKTVGEGGYWTEFDWDQAVRLGSEVVGLDYSGQYDFADTTMFWPVTHMVVPAEKTLQCTACHSENGRLDWEALGYPGDPMLWGGR